MKEVARPGDEVGWEDFQSSRRVAWKTGTSFGFRDGWAIGVTPQYAVGVWVGNASGEGRPGLIGIVVAAPILFEIFSALPSTSWFDTPEADLRRVAVCRQSGYLPGADCNELDTVWAPAASQNAPPCPYHRVVHLNSTGTRQVTSACARVDAMQHRSWFVLPPVMESYYRRRHAEYRPLPPMQPECASAESDNPIGLVYPHAGAVVYVPREMTGETGRVVFEAAHRNPGTTIFWHLDNEYIGSTSGIHQIAVNPVPGRHVLTLVDSEGNRVERVIEVLCRESAQRG
jgi:penicillin-binding protein 1C